MVCHSMPGNRELQCSKDLPLVTDPGGNKGSLSAEAGSQKPNTGSQKPDTALWKSPLRVPYFSRISASRWVQSFAEGLSDDFTCQHASMSSLSSGVFFKPLAELHVIDGRGSSPFKYSLSTSSGSLPNSCWNGCKPVYMNQRIKA
mmetsp:Transcript_11022/g.25007  ORF Transcript_11022/g.25007 Transcript_11022/m.25007 type:complete len:145 (-) Transcript_11022:1420-1854(-)